MSAIKILVIPGSLRTGSLNAKLAALSVAELASAEIDATRISLGDYPLPIYDGDLEQKSGVPHEAAQLSRLIAAHDGVLIVTPEYNAGPPPLVKNTIDWISRVQESNKGDHGARGEAFRGRPFALASASASRLGGTRCLASMRLILTACRAAVIPEQFALSFADEAYNERDRLAHDADAHALHSMLHGLVDAAQRMR